MPKFLIVNLNGGAREVEADTYQDSGHEGRWVDFRSQVKGNWITVLRVAAKDVQTVELKD